MTHSFLLLAFLLLATLHISAQPPPTAPPPSPPSPAAQLPATAEEFLDAHNQARAEVGVAPLRWSPYLAAAASRQALYQRDRMSCNFANLTASKYGGNQLWAGGAGMATAPRAAVGVWVREKAYYDHVSNTCAAGHRCGVYTQVVWRNSSEVGCVQARCPKEAASLTICFYNPPGNVVGERPYLVED
ncbi:STS14 protein [Rhodamnia argentea]|uniref:STS14 protein n=1 Tax=Rhodamnia argentea TaxID=178133 RepID=A0A8B8R032_9MYRT|nr:STS14 protein [Rhodamnia argentea]